MKAFIAALFTLLMLNPAWAESIAWLPNDAGGKIVVTDDACTLKGFDPDKTYRAISYAPNKKMIVGCWGPFKYDDSQIVIYWHGDTEFKLYPVSDFTRYGPPTQPAKNAF